MRRSSTLVAPCADQLIGPVEDAVQPEVAVVIEPVLVLLLGQHRGQDREPIL